MHVLRNQLLPYSGPPPCIIKSVALFLFYLSPCYFILYFCKVPNLYFSRDIFPFLIFNYDFNNKFYFRLIGRKTPCLYETPVNIYGPLRGRASIIEAR